MYKLSIIERTGLKKEWKDICFYDALYEINLREKAGNLKKVILTLNKR